MTTANIIKGLIAQAIGSPDTNLWAAWGFNSHDALEVGEIDGPPQYRVYVEDVNDPKETNDYEWAVSHKLYGLNAVGLGKDGKRLAVALWRSDSLYIGLHVRRVTEWEDGKP